MSIPRRFVFLVALAAAQGSLAAETPADGSADATGVISSEARDVLMGMANHLAGLEEFRFDAVAGFDVLQDDGQLIEFAEARVVTLARPAHLRIEERATDGRGHLVVFDGRKITVSDGHHGVYAQADQPGSVDDAVVYFIRELDMRLPLAPFLTTRLPLELERNVRSLEYVESTHAFGAPAHHLAGRTDVLDFQVWISAGERPLPVRIVLTYPDEGRPQYWMQLSNWDLKPRTNKDTFSFVPKGDAQQIVFAVQMSPIAADAPPEPETLGEEAP